MDELILKEVYSQVKKGYKVALAIITNTIGSTPGKMGATMAVFQNGNIIGSVGGGMIEHKVINKCIECLKSEMDYNFEYTLNDEGNIGMQCGGTAYGRWQRCQRPDFHGRCLRISGSCLLPLVLPEGTDSGRMYLP